MRTLIAISIILGLCTACGIDPTQKKKDREKLTEYLTKVQTDSLKVGLDSLCRQREAQEFDLLVDSILEIELEQVKHKLLQYKENK